MWIIYIFIIVLLLIHISLFVFPVRVEIKDSIVPILKKIKKYKSESVMEKSYLKIKIIYGITIFKLDLDKIKKQNEDKKLYKNKSNDPVEIVINTIFNFLDNMVTSGKVNKALLTPKDLKVILKNIYVKKLNFDFGLNLLNPILNAYVITLFNTAINMIIAKHQNKFNLKDLRYKTYVSGEIYNIKIHSITYIKLANIIYIIFKIIYKYRKVDKKNVRRKTSNRKFNDDSYDFT